MIITGGGKMELGEKLRQARLEAGLSQRQLCGDTITRNMLSQIENGTANPSNATLQALCTRLGKPMSYFREEAPSQNLQLLHTARQQDPETALQTLQGYLSPDPVLDGDYHALMCRVLLDLAEQNPDNAKKWLHQAKPYVQPEYLEKYLILCGEAEPDRAAEFAGQLPDNTRSQLLRAAAALQTGDPGGCICHLQCADTKPAQWYLLFADAKIAQGDYAGAADMLKSAGEIQDSRFYARLEVCYREMKDFEQAYRYACLQRS